MSEAVQTAPAVEKKEAPKQTQKQQQQSKKAGMVPNMITYKRMNYMYQASHLMMQMNREDDTDDQTANMIAMSRFYANNLKRIGTKSVLRINHDVKRTICKKCNTLLIPGETCKVKMGKRKKHIQYHCFTCETNKEYNVDMGEQE